MAVAISLSLVFRSLQVSKHKRQKQRNIRIHGTVGPHILCSVTHSYLFFRFYLFNIASVIWIIGWVVGIMGPYIYFLNWMDMLRVDPLEEEVGGDISRHKGPAYVIEDVSKEKQEELSLHRSQHKKKKKKEKAADADDA